MDGTTTPEWHRVESPVFVLAARVGGGWWVLRLNDFPEHPCFTLFADGEVVGDLDDPPAGWRLQPFARLPVLSREARALVLEAMSGLGPYGAEAGQPCRGDWCTCSVLTDEYAGRLVPPLGEPRDPPAG